MSKTREKYPLSFNKIIKKTILAFIGWLIIGIILLAIGIGILFAVAKSPSSTYLLLIGGVLVILILIFVLNYFYQKLYFNAYFYDFTESFIVIKKGVITPREISIPYERVQDVYVDQDIFDRIFRIYDVHLSTATFTSGMEAHIDGVEKPAAEGLRGELLQIIGEKIRKKPAVMQTPHDAAK